MLTASCNSSRDGNNSAGGCSTYHGGLAVHSRFERPPTGRSLGLALLSSSLSSGTVLGGISSRTRCLPVKPIGPRPATLVSHLFSIADIMEATNTRAGPLLSLWQDNASRKIPVGRTPICNPSYLRRIDPIWVHGPVPPRFWEDPANRRDYLLWLGASSSFAIWRIGTGSVSTASVNSVQGDRFSIGGARPWRPEGVLPSTRVEGMAVHKCSRTVLGFEGELPPVFGLAGGSPGIPGAGRLAPSHAPGLFSPCGRRAREQAPGVSGESLESGLSEMRVAGMEVRAGAVWVLEVCQNRHRYLRWLGRQLGFRRPRDWYKITAGAIKSNHGTTLIQTLPFYDLDCASSARSRLGRN